MTDKGTILVIEDDADLLRLLEVRLVMDGYDVLSAKDGESGLEKATEALPQLILLDWTLPGMDGLEVLASLKSRRGTTHLPVIMLTAKRMMGDVEKALAFGATDYFTKPIDITAAIEKINKTLGYDKSAPPDQPKR